MTQIIVPTDAPGVNIVRGIEVWGARATCEVIYDDVRVPVEPLSQPAQATGPRKSGSAPAASTTA
jgi:alkylation response protein AidB-like acyl-CoA dehydrogenase